MYIVFTLEVFPFFLNFIDAGLNQNRNILYLFFIFIFLLSYFFFDRRELFNNNNDILFKFFKLLFTTPSKFITYIFIEIKKFFLYSINFKFYHFIKTNLFFFGDKISNIFIIWRPLFKRWSYFGYYRSNRSKWIK